MSSAAGSATEPVPPEDDGNNVPLPADEVDEELDDAHFTDEILLASQDLGVCEQTGQPLLEFMTSVCRMSFGALSITGLLPRDTSQAEGRANMATGDFL